MIEMRIKVKRREAEFMRRLKVLTSEFSKRRQLRKAAMLSTQKKPTAIG